MKRLLISIAALALSAGTVHAERILKEDPVTDRWVWVDTDTQAEYPVLRGTNLERPTDCPDGAYFIGKDPVSGTKQVVQSCNTDELYGLSAPGAQTGSVSGEPYPEGTYLLLPNTLTDGWNVRIDQDL